MSDRSREPESAPGGSAGGNALRALRKRARRTQLWVEAEAELGTGYLQRIETGKILHPDRSTIERVLDALDARFGERRDILEKFGYIVTIDPPTEHDRAWAAKVCLGEITQLPFPAWALDCTFCPIVWNRHTAALFGPAGERVFIRAQSAEHRDRVPGELLENWFDPDAPIGRAVAEPEQLWPAMLRAMRFEVQQLGDAAWLHKIMDAIAGRNPHFRRYWRQALEPPGPVVSARALVPLKLITPDGVTRSFRLSAEPFSRDPRFRIVYYFPADIAALAWCEATGAA